MVLYYHYSSLAIASSLTHSRKNRSKAADELIQFEYVPNSAAPPMVIHNSSIPQGTRSHAQQLHLIILI